MHLFILNEVGRYFRINGNTSEPIFKLIIYNENVTYNHIQSYSVPMCPVETMYFSDMKSITNEK